MGPEVKAVTDQASEELYLTAERKRVPEVHLEITRRLTDANKFRRENDQLPISSRSTIIARSHVYRLTRSWRRVTANVALIWNSGCRPWGL